MAIFILYWLFSTFYVIGSSYVIAGQKIKLEDVVVSILLGWFILPMSLGTIAQVGIEEDK